MIPVKDHKKKPLSFSKYVIDAVGNPYKWCRAKLLLSGYEINRDSVTRRILVSRGETEPGPAATTNTTNAMV